MAIVWTLLEILSSGIIAFAATNVDDLFVLMTFFSEVPRGKIKIRHVVFGQYLGIITLIGLSVAGSVGALLLPSAAIGLLGIIPIFIGVKALACKADDTDNKQGGEGDVLDQKETGGNEGGEQKLLEVQHQQDVYGGIGGAQNPVPEAQATAENSVIIVSTEPNTSGGQEEERSYGLPPAAVHGTRFDLKAKLLVVTEASYNIAIKFLSPSVLRVAGTTIGNGADNIGVYIPLFSNYGSLAIVFFVIIFLLLVAVWCTASYKLINHPAVLKYVEKYGDKIAPFIFIGLGIYIFINNGTITWFVGLLS